LPSSGHPAIRIEARRPVPSGLERRAVRSDELLHGRREIVIVHHDEEYRLRVTRAGKLILTK
jgi:hemin uptake protein HemP